MNEVIVIFFSGVLAGVLNAVAGGGSFIAFPTLLLMGLPAIQANVTNTVALWPGLIASVLSYRHQIKQLNFPHLRQYILVSSVGSIVGAILLLFTAEAIFKEIIPWLLMLATSIFALSDKIDKGLHKINLALILFLLFLTAIYGGYFGAGMGIVIVAILSLISKANIHALNGFKNILCALIDSVAIIIFIYAGLVDWYFAFIMALGSMLGGYLAAHFVQKIKPSYTRALIITIGSLMSAYFLLKF